MNRPRTRTAKVPASSERPALAPAAKVEQVLVLLEAMDALGSWLNHAFQCGGSVSVSARKVLQVLERHGPQSVPGIARLRTSTRQNIQIVVNRLEAAGYVELSDNPGHKLSALVCLTQKGEDVLQACEAAEQKFLERVAKEISESEMDAIAKNLSRLRDVLDKTIGHSQHKRILGEQTAPRPQRSKGVGPRKADSETSGGSSEIEKEEEFPINLL